MKISIDLTHPADFHFFKNFGRIMMGRGHEVLFTAVDKDVTYQLLAKSDLPYKTLGAQGKGLFQKVLNIPKMDWRFHKIIKPFNPDIFLSCGSLRSAHSSFLLGKPFLTLDGAEFSPYNKYILNPFADAIFTPKCFKLDYGKRQIFFDSFFELAYLHPKYFQPKDDVFELFGIDSGKPYALVRFVAFKAGHDINQGGVRSKLEFVRALSKVMRVYVDSEDPLDGALTEFLLPNPTGHMHDLLAHSSLYVGEGITMAHEAAVLGVHSVLTNTLTCGLTEEFVNKYELVDHFRQIENLETDALAKAIELAANPNLKSDGQRKRQKILNEKIDITEYLVNHVENFMAQKSRS